MKPTLRLLLVIMALLPVKRLRAQDPVFSQPYLAPLYLNPAATGASDNDLRFSLLHRRQWLSIPSQFNYTVFSVDKFFPAIKGGLGLMATDFSEGYLKRTGIYGSYAYTICSGEANKAGNEDRQTWFVSGGLQFGVAQRRIDYSQLLFSDQINEDGIIPGSMSGADVPIYNKRWYPDFSGGLYLNHEIGESAGYLLIGASAHHINRPDESLTATSDSFRSPMPIRWDANVSYQYVGEQWVWGLALLAYQQNNNRTVQLGFEIRPADYDFSVGAWAHWGNSFNSFNAVGLSVTYTFHGSGSHKQKLMAGVSQDFPLNGSGLSYTSGSTELGLSWDYDTNASGTGDMESDSKCKPRVSTMTCPSK